MNPDVEKFSQRIRGSSGDLVQTYRLARGFSDSNRCDLLDLSGAVHALYELPNGGVVLVRPDGYIGYRSDSFDIIGFQTFLNKIFVRPAEG